MLRTDGPLTDLALSRGDLDRSALERRSRDLVPALLSDPATRVLDVRGDRVPVRWSRDQTRADLVLRPPGAGDSAALGLFLGRDASSAAYLAVVGDGEAGDEHGPTTQDGVSWDGLRRCGSALDGREAGAVATALALANWHRLHTHCPRCGHETEPVEGGWVRRCPADSSEHYPRTDPAVIMSVVDDEGRLLLGRGATWPEGRFSVLAGFVEPGESFEAAVAREVAEEVGVEVADVRYLGNQPWPFPSSVMIGFTARALGSTLTLDPVELAEARWVTRDEYRTALRDKQIHTPSGISIAKRLIEHWLGSTVESAGR